MDVEGEFPRAWFSRWGLPQAAAHGENAVQLRHLRFDLGNKNGAPKGDPIDYCLLRFDSDLAYPERHDDLCDAVNDRGKTDGPPQNESSRKRREHQGQTSDDADDSEE